MNKTRKNYFLVSHILLTLLIFSLTPILFAQDKTLEELTAEARQMVTENRYIDALPILEKIILSYPKDAEMWADFGIAIVSNAVTLDDPAERKEEMERGIKALTKAKQLGTENVRALYLLDEIENSDSMDNFSHEENPELEKALREGEAHFGRGEYDKAFKAYERAYKLDPKSYEAVLFMGDCFYAQGKFKEAEPYFAKAVEISPDLDTAHRFWGDALLYQDKNEQALDKFLNALLAKPFSRMNWESINRWATKTEANYDLIKIIPPGNKEFGSIEIKESLLKSEDGTDKWKFYDEMSKEQKSKKAAAGQRYTLSDELNAWKKAAENFRADIKAGKIKYPDRGLINLVKLDDENLLEPYILLLRPQPSFGEDYAAYREKNADKIKQFVRQYILNLKK